MSIKIGVTEAGDAGLDMSWYNKLSTVNGAILITKNLNDEFIKAVSALTNVIVHVTCTGYGGTVLEPNVPTTAWTHGQIKKLLAVFDANRVVLRIDPIIPTRKGLMTFERAVGETEIGRIRISVLDMYKHVQDRFTAAKLPRPYGGNFTASNERFAMLGRFLEDRFPDRVFETCAEPKLHAKNVVMRGCVSDFDLDALHLCNSRELPIGRQRSGCLCAGYKTELLENKTRCPHGCLYCYWQDKRDAKNQ
jgi:DNA repair photolyase